MVVRRTGTISDVAGDASYRRRRGPRPAKQRSTRGEGRGEDGRLRDRWTTTVASTIAYSMCKSRLSRLFLGFNRRRRRAARERGQGTSLSSFVGPSCLLVSSQLHSNARCTEPCSYSIVRAGWQTHARNESKNRQAIARSGMQTMRRGISKRCPVSQIFKPIFAVLLLYSSLPSAPCVLRSAIPIRQHCGLPNFCRTPGIGT